MKFSIRALKFSAYKLPSILLLGSFLTACGGDDRNYPPMMEDREYQISITNLTASQPFSPVAVVLHNDDWRAYQVGTAASVELEDLAESGSNSALLNNADTDVNVYTTSSGMGIIGPGSSESLMVSTKPYGTSQLSLVSMLVNTNDAVITLNGADISMLMMNESKTFRLVTYDAGTEANTETNDTIPGPAASGGMQEGFNAARDDVRNAVYVHAGVVTMDDGLATSTLSNIHRWDNPAATVTITRVQ